MLAPTFGKIRHQDRHNVHVQVNSPDESEKFPARIKGQKGGQIQLTIGGELSMRTLPRVWPQVVESLRRMQAGRVTIDVSQLKCDDSACLTLFAEIRRLVAAGRGELSIVGLKPDLKALLDSATLPEPGASPLPPPMRLGFIARIGQRTADRLAQIKLGVTFIGELGAAFVWSAAHPRQARWRELALICEKAGADALPVVLLLVFLIGVMLAFQAAGQTERYGMRTVVPNVVVVAMTRELGPLIAALLLAGRTGSAFAAELGTMKVNEELNALRAMGLDPVRFLAIPRVVSLILVAPLLSIFSDLAGIIGGYTVMADHGFSIVHYMVQVGHVMNWGNVFGGIGKTVVEGLLIGAAACLSGIRTGSGPSAVGDSTTRAVVSAIILVVATDGFFGVVYYYFGI